MNSEYLLDAIGLVDDDLIREAEAYRPSRRNYSRWLSLAACLAVVLTLGYAVTHLEFGMGGGSAAPSAPSGGNGVSTPAASTPAASAPAVDSDSREELPAEGTAPAIMVDGVLYRSTGEPVPGEPDPAVIRTASSYTGGIPEEDGQSNIAPSVQYAETDLGVVVLVEEEWILFEPAE